jgi:hypothetical protein
MAINSISKIAMQRIIAILMRANPEVAGMVLSIFSSQRHKA